MLPLYLLNSIKGQPLMVELKRGETINGILDNCDSWMNLTLKDAVIVDAQGENFHKVTDIYVRGIQIKYMRMSNNTIDKFREQQQREKDNNNRHNNNSNNNNRQFNSGQQARYNNRNGKRYNNQGGSRNYNNQQNRGAQFNNRGGFGNSGNKE